MEQSYQKKLAKLLIQIKVMKKVLEGELLSIAHRILQMKDKEVDNLYKEAKGLYEKLLILKFYQDTSAKGKAEDVTEEEWQEKLQAAYAEEAEEQERRQMPEELIDEKYPRVPEDKQTIHLLETEDKIAPETETEEAETKQQVNYDTDFIEEPYEEENEDDALLHQYLDEHEALLKESEQQEKEPEEENTTADSDENPIQDGTKQQKANEYNPFDGFNFGDVEFIRVEDVEEIEVHKFDAEFTAKEEDTEKISSATVTDIRDKEESPEQNQNTLFNVEQVAVNGSKPHKTKSINDIYNGTIAVGLNDRIAFEKHLFGGSAEDLNRVLSQLNTVSSMDEAKSLIEHLVKPEYNNWEGKEEYEDRFLALIESKFT